MSDFYSPEFQEQERNAELAQLAGWAYEEMEEAMRDAEHEAEFEAELQAEARWEERNIPSFWNEDWI